VVLVVVVVVVVWLEAVADAAGGVLLEGGLDWDGGLGFGARAATTGPALGISNKDKKETENKGNNNDSRAVIVVL
jgi:hypothetical protein